MDEGKIMMALQHIVGAIHQLAVSSPSGHPNVVAMVNSAMGLIAEMTDPKGDEAPAPEPAPAAEQSSNLIGQAIGEFSPPPNPVPVVEPPAEQAPAPSWSPPSEPAA